MSFRSKLNSAFCVVFAAAAFSVAGSAQTTAAPAGSGDASDKMEHRGGGQAKGFGRKMGGGFMRELRGVNLTDAQKEQIRAIHEANKPDQARTEEMRAMIEAKRGGTLTPEQQEKFKAARQQARAKGEQIREQIFAILTPEQRQQVEQNRQEMKLRREQRRNERRGNSQTDADKPADN